MKLPKVNTIDFETDPIQKRPVYPPKPVGVSIKRPGERKARYYAWGHPTGNNCTLAQAKAALKAVWDSGEPMLFHNAKFDVDVAQTHMDCGPVAWELIHDTMFIVFLLDPHSMDLGLKPMAEKLLGMDPDERDAVRDWVTANKKMIEATYGYKVMPSTWGGAIAYAPGDIVEAYANGDVTRTEGLFKYGWPKVVERGMESAYDRERELMPILLENERVGMRVDVRALRRDIKLYNDALGVADAWLRKRLKVKDLNLDNDNDVAVALAASGMVADEDWTLTKTGKRSVSKKNLLVEHYTDPRVASVFGYRNRLVTCLKMFMYPWLEQAEARGDQHISTNWNQVRGTDKGTRTGRPSTSDPNFLNVSKTWDDKNDGYIHPGFLKLPELPLVRRYILPDKGEVFLHRDFNGQELRILGHYEDGPLMRAYLANPRMDVHDHVRQLIEEITGLIYARTPVKVVNFRRIYGGGAPVTAQALNISIESAKQLLAAQDKAIPGRAELVKDLTAMAKRDEPVTTWGGREYYVEPAKYDERFKRFMDYYYKLLNYLIQGSAADATKEAIIRYINHPLRRGRFLVTVYDEINVSVAKHLVAHEMAVLRECMEGLEFDVPMLSDGKTGPNWADMKKYEDPPWNA